MRTLTIILVITIMLAVLVGVVVYAYEEKWGRFAYFVGEASAAILVMGLISSSAYRRRRKSSRQYEGQRLEASMGSRHSDTLE
jgi:hypothetical protein